MQESSNCSRAILSIVSTIVFEKAETELKHDNEDKLLRLVCFWQTEKHEG